MSISVEGSKGRGKSMGVDLNLVPFIDFLSCLLAFLMMSAVMTEIHSLEIEQSITPPDQDQPPPDPPPPPPLTVHLRADGMWMARKVEDGVQIPPIGEENNWAKLEELMKKDHETYPAEEMIVINTDDGVEYLNMVKVLDLSRTIGYPKTLLAGGPAAAVAPWDAATAVPGAGAPL